MTSGTGPEVFAATAAEHRVLDSARRCCERWGFERVTVDDIAADAGISRATLYRLFPGGKDVLFEALRNRELLAFFDKVRERVLRADGFEDVVVSVLVAATIALREDDHLKIMLASQPGELLYEVQVADVGHIMQMATEFLSPLVAPSIGPDRSAELAEWMTRLILSYFFTPSPHVDLGDTDSAARFARAFILPAYSPSLEPVHAARVTTTAAHPPEVIA